MKYLFYSNWLYDRESGCGGPNGSIVLSASHTRLYRAQNLAIWLRHV